MPARKEPWPFISWLKCASWDEPAGVNSSEWGAKIWSPSFKDLTPRRLSAAKSLGLKIVAWTLNDAADIASAIDLGIDGIISDYPDRVLAELKRRGAR